MEIPQAGVARGFEEQASHDVIGVADAVRRKMVRGEECLEARFHSGCAFEGAGFFMQLGEKLRECGVRASYVWLRGMCLLG